MIAVPRRLYVASGDTFPYGSDVEGGRSTATMTTEYATSEEHLPEDLSGDVTLQVTDKATKEIFVTRARIARDAGDLADPEPLTVVRGPHENIEEQWYIEIIETGADEPEVDREALRESIRRSKEGSNVVNARSDDLRALLLYLVETGTYDSVSEAVREILHDHLTAAHPGLVDEYVDLRAELERDDITTRLGRTDR